MIINKVTLDKIRQIKKFLPTSFMFLSRIKGNLSVWSTNFFLKMEVKPYGPTSIEKKRLILANLDKKLEDLARGVQEAREWLKTQKHFPEVPSERLLEFFVIMTRFDLETLKEKLDYYYTLRSEMPEVFAISNPSSHSMQETLNFTQIVPLPKLIDNSDTVQVVKLRSSLTPIGFDAHSWLAAIVNIHEIFMQQNIALHSVVIYDHEHLSLAHVLKITPKFIINSAKILEKVFSDRVRALHVINYPQIFHLVLTLSKPLMKPELYEKFRLHSSKESLAKEIPSDILPRDYGGNEKSLDELEVLWRAKLTEYKDRFDKLETLKVNESLRRSPRKKEPEGMFEAFSKLINL